MRPALLLSGAALVVVLVVVLTAAPVLPHTAYTGYSHGSADRVYPRGKWVTVASVPAGGCCRPVTFTVQAPVSPRTGGPLTSLRVRFLRLPDRDGTGDLDMRLGNTRRWHVTHSHTVRGFRGRMAAQVRVAGTGTWRSPYRIMKGFR